MDETDKFTWDDKLTGFGLRERGGRRSWVSQYRLGAKQRRLKIGSAEKLSKAQARDVARKRLAQVELGQDPAAERQQARKEAKFTLKVVAADYLASKKAELRPSTFRNLTLYLGIDPDAVVVGLRKRKRDLSGYWAALHSVPINAIDRRDVAAELGRITRKHGATARARTTLSAFFAWAMGEGIAQANPVVGTNPPAEAAARALDRRQARKTSIASCGYPERSTCRIRRSKRRAGLRSRQR
jgi:hypothetical protein